MKSSKILQFATEKHEGQTRIGGAKYITHPIAVAEILKSKGFHEEDYVHTAYLHDILEDTDATDCDVLELTNERVLTAVQLLTKRDGYNNATYLRDIKEDELARLVKLADRIHNLRSALVAYKSFQKRYIKETEEHYVDLSKDTVFEDDIKAHLQALKCSYELK